jgi:hypothetical protein
MSDLEQARNPGVAVAFGEYLWIPPRSNGDFLIVDPSGTMHHLDIEFVECVEVPRKRAKAA